MVHEYKKRYSGVDLSGKDNSLAGILKDIVPVLANCKTKQEIINMCHEKVDPFVNHGISTTTSYKFFQALERSKGLTGAMITVSNFCLAGCGLATY